MNSNNKGLTHQISLDDSLSMVCRDPASGQSLQFSNDGGKDIIKYSFTAEGVTKEIVLTPEEAADLNAWRNNGRRTSYWDWPGWEAVRKRGETNKS